MIISSVSATRPDQYRSPSASPASRASRAFSPREAWKIETDFDSDSVRSKDSGLCRASRLARARSSRLRSAVACGSAASSPAYRPQRPSCRRPAAAPAACHREPSARRTGDRMGHARPLGPRRIRAPARLDPTSGPEAHRPSHSPRCSRRPGSGPETGRPASTHNPGHNPCSACRQRPGATTAQRSGRN